MIESDETKSVFDIVWHERWRCFMATDSRYAGIVGIGPTASVACNNLLISINDYASRHVYDVMGGWSCRHLNSRCVCTDRDGARLSGLVPTEPQEAR